MNSKTMNLVVAGGEVKRASVTVGAGLYNLMIHWWL